MKLVFQPAAAHDIREARAWYRAHSETLEARFLSELARTLRNVIEHPLAYEEEEPDVRRVVLSPFPYRVYYHPLPDTVVVLAVVHTSRRPGTWKQPR
jgi:plasmid stabilization system protein ParE